MALTYPPFRKQNIDRLVAENATAITGGDTLALNNRSLVRLQLSGTGVWDMEAPTAGNDGLCLVLLTESVTGSARLENSTNVLLSSEAFLPQEVGEAIGFIWNASLTKWVEIWRTQSYDTFSGLIVKNISGALISKGDAVYIDGGSGGFPTIQLADNTSEAAADQTAGLVYDDIPDGEVGYVISSGLLQGVDTNLYPPGTILWLATAGGWTSTKPLSPAHLVQLGIVVTQGSLDGSIQVLLNVGWEIDELHNVLITDPSYGAIIYYDQTDNQLWKNAPTNRIVWRNDNIRLGIGVPDADPDEAIEVYGNTQNILITNTAETEAGLIFVDSAAPTTQYAKILYDSGTLYLNAYVNDTTPAITAIDGPNAPVAQTYPVVTTQNLLIDGFCTYVPKDIQYLIADDQVVSTAEQTFIKLSSNVAQPASRTFTLTDGDYTGHLIIIEIIAGSAELPETGNMKIQGTWRPNAFDAITLIWDGTYWVQTSRASNN